MARSVIARRSRNTIKTALKLPGPKRLGSIRGISGTVKAHNYLRTPHIKQPRSVVMHMRQFAPQKSVTRPSGTVTVDGHVTNLKGGI